MEAMVSLSGGSAQGVIQRTNRGTAKSRQASLCLPHELLESERIYSQTVFNCLHSYMAVFNRVEQSGQSGNIQPAYF
jgi:hypothetical protein